MPCTCAVCINIGAGLTSTIPKGHEGREKDPCCESGDLGSARSSSTAVVAETPPALLLGTEAPVMTPKGIDFSFFCFLAETPWDAKVVCKAYQAFY